MDWSLKLKWCTWAAIGAVTLGVVVSAATTVSTDSSSKRKKRASASCTEKTCRSDSERKESVTMAATVENDRPAEQHVVSQLATTMEQLKVTHNEESAPSSPASPAEHEEAVGDEENGFIPDRDSANHSPADFLSGNLHSDSHSESSTDSGKGGSECANANHVSSRFDSITPPMSPVMAHHSHGLHGHHAMHLHQDVSGASGPIVLATAIDCTSGAPISLVPLAERLFVYEFEIPQLLVGLLIGKMGAYVNYIKAQTGANLLVRDHNRRFKICAIEGTKSEIDAALAIIRQKFPPKKYPGVTMAQVNVVPEPTVQPVLPDSIQLVLPAGVSCDVMVSAVVAPNHVFVQQVTHPTYPSLARLDHCMAQCYNEFPTPPLPRPVRPSIVCAAPSMTDGGWYRAKIVAVYPPASMVTTVDENGQVIAVVADPTEVSNDAQCQTQQQLEGAAEEEDYEVEICYVDYGGYSRVPVSCLRQIRADFMTLPFQAIECLLANVAPANDEEGWSVEAYEELENLTRERMLQAQAMAYSLEGLPLVYLFQTDPSVEEALINRQLVNRAVAQWVEPQLLTN